MERREMLNMIGMGGIASWPAINIVDQTGADKEGPIRFYPTFTQLRQDNELKPGDLVATFGYHQINDGGAAQYHIGSSASHDNTSGSMNGVFTTGNGLVARLINVTAVNYPMFGAKGDGQHMDGKAILAAHEYANENQLPVHNLTGEFLIGEMRNIPIETNVQWGQSVFYIEEKYNTNKPVFHVRSRHKSVDIPADGETGKAVINQLKPGVQIIPELKGWENHLIHLYDDQDRIAFRAGEAYHSKGRAREELIYVSQEGRILGDVAWSFKETVTIKAYPAEFSYLLMEGGTFYLSGESPADPPSMYTHNGILVTRSRTTIQRQWVGIGPGGDVSMVPQSGFYYFSTVYDVQLNDIRLLPREKDRIGQDRDVPQGTYGIGGNRVLELSLEGVVAEGTGIHWGVFGTNMMKNVSLSHCRINRFDVHFHLWNLTMRDCEIGQKGITVTGGGRLFIENTTCYQHRFISFRRDYGAKWEGDIFLNRCTLKPPYGYDTTLFSFVANDFEYGYPIGMARTITVKDMVIDYSGFPGNDEPCWLIRTSDYSVTSNHDRLFFPSSVRFQYVRVTGRDRGVRVVYLKKPNGYKVSQAGQYNGDVLRTNSNWELDHVDLESWGTEDKVSEYYHLIMEDREVSESIADEHSPFFNLTVRNCNHFSAWLTSVRIRVQVEDTLVHRLILNDTKECEGVVNFDRCAILPVAESESDSAFRLDTTLGTTFINCVIHLPLNEENLALEKLSVIPFIQINKSLKYNHLNTRLSNGFARFLKDQNFPLNKDFKDKLLLHSG